MTLVARVAAGERTGAWQGLAAPLAPAAKTLGCWMLLLLLTALLLLLLLLVFGGAVDVAGPSEALAEMCVCTARCCLRPVEGWELLLGPAAVVATCCCLPEKQGGQAGPLTKLSRHRLHAGVCIYACSRLLRTEPRQSLLVSCYC